MAALPPHVASSELITSAWGNATVDELTQLRNGTRPIAGAVGGGGGSSGGGLQIIDYTFPAQAVAGTLSIWALVRADFTSGTSYDFELVAAGSTVARFAIYTFVGFEMVNLSATVTTAAGTGVQLIVRGAGSANLTVYADPKVNRLDYLWLPVRGV